MKTIILFLQLTLSIGAYGQVFNGDYASFSTSYQDDKNAENNFREDTKFNLAVHIEADAKNGRVIIQDPRIPQKLLIYKDVHRTDYKEIDDKWIGIYDCLTDHLDIEIKTRLTFYINEHNELNLLVSDSLSSQMFFNLTKQ